MVLDQFADMIGLGRDSEDLVALMVAIGEVPIISKTPDDFNDSAGATEYYKFINSGIEIGFRGEVLNHLHFYIQEHEGYGAYRGELFGVPFQDVSEADILRNLGGQDAQGGGRMDMLIGYVYRWIRYDRRVFALRAEFLENGKLRKLSLIKR